MVPLVTELAPERWKVFQVLPMGGQNDGAVDPLLISDAEFAGWCRRHAMVEVAGVPFVAETNEEMLGSYAMLDALCR
jgi:radical S-adenosyl methionine domain-containing protein 2